MAAANLRCPQCNFENEQERVYCHSCGAKLDRSLLPKAEDDRKHETSGKARKRIQKMTNPRSNPIVREFKALLSTAVWATIAASLILMARKPAGVPDGKPTGEMRLVQSDLMEALESPVPRSVAFSQDDLNQALKQSLRGKDAGLIPGIKFERAYVKLLPGVVRMICQQSVGSYPLYSSVDYRVAMTDGQFRPVLIGGSYGRLPVHPLAMKYLDFQFKKLWPALKRERGFLTKLQVITVTEGQVTLVTKGAVPK